MVDCANGPLDTLIKYHKVSETITVQVQEVSIKHCRCTALLPNFVKLFETIISDCIVFTLILILFLSSLIKLCAKIIDDPLKVDTINTELTYRL